MPFSFLKKSLLSSDTCFNALGRLRQEESYRAIPLLVLKENTAKLLHQKSRQIRELEFLFHYFALICVPSLYLASCLERFNFCITIHQTAKSYFFSHKLKHLECLFPSGQNKHQFFIMLPLTNYLVSYRIIYFICYTLEIHKHIY